MASKKSGKAAGLAALAGLAYMASQGKDKKEAPSDSSYDALERKRMPAKAEDSTESGDFMSRRLNRIDTDDGKAYSTNNLSPMSSSKSAPASVARTASAAKAPSEATPAGAYRGMRSDMKNVGGGRSGGRGGPEAGEEDAYRSARATAGPAVSTGGSGGSRGPAIGEEKRARIDKAFEAPSEENIQKGLEIGVGGPSLRALNAAAKGLANRGLKSKVPQLDRPGTVSGEKFVMRDYKDPNVAASVPQKALPAPRKGDVTDVTPKNTNPRSLMGESREDAKADRFRRGLEDLADNSMKRGGKVKKMASGGMTSSASSASRRGDGIASKGKTRCKMY